jgi:hypothetical protein
MVDLVMSSHLLPLCLDLGLALAGFGLQSLPIVERVPRPVHAFITWAVRASGMCVVPVEPPG